MANAIFEGIYNETTKEYLTTNHTAADVEQMEADGQRLVGVIHDDEGQRELTFETNSTDGIFPASWTQYWGEPDPLTDAEIIEDLLGRWSDEFPVDVDYWTACPYKQSYPKNEG